MGKVFAGWLVAPSRLGEVFVAFTEGGVAFLRSADSIHGDPDAFAQAYRDRFARPLHPAKKAPAGLLPALRGTAATAPALDLAGSDFERAVLTATQRIPAGQTRPYSWVAREAGHPRAVRAAGTVLARRATPTSRLCRTGSRSEHRAAEIRDGRNVLAPRGYWAGQAPPGSLSWADRRFGATSR
ncbi:MAG: MGMT family protein [Actinomycetota bacterium]|nr:MGMT family protein [Actinomycetota bacterium]